MTEQRELDWAKMIDVALTLPGSTGDTYCRFYDYSFTNQILLAMQGVREPVATYKSWLALGRQVRKGEKAHRIIRPIVVKRTKADATGEEHEVAYRRFKEVACLFAASQTDGEELPPVQPKDWDLGAALSALAIEQVPYASTDGNSQGYSSERTYAINPVATNPTHTTFHELAHIVLGHTAREVLGEYVSHRGRFEFEAEATAYLVLHELGQLDETAASHSRAYVQGWLHGVDKPNDAAIRKVFHAVDVILKAGRPAKAEQVAA